MFAGLRPRIGSRSFGARKPSRLDFAAVAATIVLLVFAAWEGSIVLHAAAARGDEPIGQDFSLYLGRAASWLEGDGFYLPRQLTGTPYNVQVGDAVYPPTILLILLPFRVLPAALWWLVPIAVTAVSIARLRPAPWSWPILAAIMCYPRMWLLLIYGNPAMWALAALAASTVWVWPGVFTMIKLTLAPFGLVGAWNRSWWRAAAVAVLLSVPFGTLWFDYLRAIMNARNGFGADYLIGDWPIAVAIIVVSVGRGQLLPIRWSVTRRVGAGISRQ